MNVGRVTKRGAWLAVVCSATLMLAACGTHDTRTPTAATTTTIPTGESNQRITVHGVVRTYRVFRPAGLASPAALVVMLHGAFGSGAQAEQAYHWDAQATSGHFLVVYPDGIGRAWNTGGGCCGIPSKTKLDDVGFLTAMVKRIEASVPIDTKRVFAAGISNGGMMSYTLACASDVFAAIGPDAATMLGPCASPAPLSVIHIHGTTDKNIPYDGGEGSGVAHINGPSAPAVNAAWRATDHCDAPVISTVGVVTTSLATCPGGRAVELITIAGAGHQWPGGEPNGVGARLLGLDQPSTALDATATIWQFFAAHPKA